jgi:hypothetical protein
MAHWTFFNQATSFSPFSYPAIRDRPPWPGFLPLPDDLLKEQAASFSFGNQAASWIQTRLGLADLRRQKADAEDVSPLRIQTWTAA